MFGWASAASAGLRSAVLLRAASLAGLAPSLQGGFLSSLPVQRLGPLLKGEQLPRRTSYSNDAEVHGARSSAQGHFKLLLVSYMFTTHLPKQVIWLSPQLGVRKYTLSLRGKTLRLYDKGIDRGRGD